MALWTHHGNLAPPRGPQAQCLSYSADRGRTWTAFSGNPVVPNPDIPDFRDPKVFRHAETQRWVMALAVADCIHFYTSPDLKIWTFASAFGAEEGSHAGVWECPDLFSNWPWTMRRERCAGCLIVSISGEGGSQTQYFVGEL